ncbi:hypothetical protein QNI19_32515 [Cytophagaceae bacterium DM2B3-1]|uniref:Uncharacterized protein n=1 Tax=Xanthocytophaga flava TaxID=3048013 RepID=A0ABT7CYQ4_9BACT|nr:hypothetical protein [Xanthocytophaga flavus]MDJ1497709.1 hypothetical protein [Xanthocytophaga flavus]
MSYNNPINLDVLKNSLKNVPFLIRMKQYFYRIIKEQNWFIFVCAALLLFLGSKSSCLYAQSQQLAEAYLVRVVSQTDYRPEKYYLLYQVDASGYDWRNNHSKSVIASTNPSRVYTNALTGIYLGETLFQCCSFGIVSQSIPDSLLDEKKVRFTKAYYRELEDRIDPSLFGNPIKDSSLHLFYTTHSLFGNKNTRKRIMITRLNQVDFCSCVNPNVAPHPYVMLKKAHIQQMTKEDTDFLKRNSRRITQLPIIKSNSY